MIQFKDLEFKRYASLDYFRGLAIFLMLIYNLVPLFSKGVPVIFQHGREDIFLFGDLIAPFFQYIMGVSLAISTCRRRAKGQEEHLIFQHVVNRSVILIGIGLILDAFVFKTIFTWGVLETLGLSYFLAYFVLKYSFKGKIFSILGLYLIYVYLSSYNEVVQFIRSVPHGGPLSVISWTPITIFGVICGEHLILKKKKNFERFLLFSGIVLILIGYFANFSVPFNKRLVSISYSIASSGISILFFLGLYYLVEAKRSRYATLLFSPLKEFGASALLVWILQYLFAYYPVYYIVGRTKFLHFYQGSALAIGIIVLLWIIARTLNRRGVVLKL